MKNVRQVINDLEQHFGSYAEFDREFFRRMRYGGIDDSRYTLPLAILCLAWIGVKRHSAPEILKTDVHFEEGVVYDREEGVYRQCPEDAIRHLFHCANMHIYSYDSPFVTHLLRTRNSQKITDAVLMTTLSRLNSAVGMYRGIGFSYGIIYESGLFSRACQAELRGEFAFPNYNRNRALKEEDKQKIIEMFDRDYPSDWALFDYMTRYRAYRKKFYPELLSKD